MKFFGGETEGTRRCQEAVARLRQHFTVRSLDEDDETQVRGELRVYRVCGLAVVAGIAMKFGTAHGRSRLGVGGAKCIGSYGRKGVPPAPCNFGAS